jgi:hypothetical protein
MHYSGISLKELKEKTKDTSQDIRCPGWDSNQTSPGYKLEALPLAPACSVIYVDSDIFHNKFIVLNLLNVITIFI